MRSCTTLLSFGVRCTITNNTFFVLLIPFDNDGLIKVSKTSAGIVLICCLNNAKRYWTCLLPSQQEKATCHFFPWLGNLQVHQKTLNFWRKNIFEGISFLVSWSVVSFHGSAYTTAYQIIAAVLSYQNLYYRILWPHWFLLIDQTRMDNKNRSI